MNRPSRKYENRQAGQWLRKNREARGWSQTQLAEALGEGWDQSQISRMEKGERRLPLDRLGDLAVVFKMKRSKIAEQIEQEKVIDDVD